MADKNVTSAKNKDTKLKEVESKQKKSKNDKLSFKKIITIIIIVVLALLMVGGVYYVVVMVSQSKAEKESAWGSYDGEDIRIENNNVFYNTLVNDSNLQTAYLSGDYNTMLSSYYGAYQAQVLFLALSKEAKEAGIVAPQELVNKLILNTGIYNGEDGTFSEEKFNASSETEKVNVNNFYTNYYPYTVVVYDLQSTLVGSKEQDFVVKMSEDTRTFDYFVINYNAYPNDLAAEYGAQNAAMFAEAGISIISTSSEEKAIAAHDALVAGSAWNDVVASYSEDSYAANNGEVGTLKLFSIASNLNDQADLEKITALEVGSFSSPVATPNGGYTIYKLDSAVKEADFTDKETLAAVKYYISSNNIDDITPYVDAAVATAQDLAKNDFALAAESANSAVISIQSVNDNVAGSQYLAGLDLYDTNGYLSSAASDEAVSRELFTADEGYVTGAMAVSEAENTYVIAKVTGIDKNNESMSYATSMLYGYYAMQQPVYDRFYNVLGSDKHVDNFYSQFFATLFSSST